MSLLSRTTPINVWIEKDGEPYLRELSVPGPITEPLREHISICNQMERDDLSVDEIRHSLRAWMDREPLVDKLAIDYAGGRYSVVILATRLTKQLLVSLHATISPVVRMFSDFRPIVSILSQGQEDSSSFRVSDCLLARSV